MKTTLFEQKCDILYEKVMSKLPTDLKRKIHLQSTRKGMSDDAFLMPAEKKFPVKRPGSNKYDCKLLYAAYVRAKQHKYVDVAAKAKSLLQSQGCSKKLHINIGEGFAGDNDELREIIKFLSSGGGDESYPEDDEDQCFCICPECGEKFEQDAESCSDMACSKCEVSLVDNNAMNEESVKLKKTEGGLGDKMRTLVESRYGAPTPTERDKFICSSCKTILPSLVNESEKGVCPVCANEMSLLRESYEVSERRYRCPRCISSYVFAAINEDTCRICGTYMVVEAPAVKEVKGNPIPMSTE